MGYRPTMENQAERKWRFPWKPGYIGVVEITQSFQKSGIPVLIVKMTLVNIMGFILGYPSLCRLFRFQGPELVGRWTDCSSSSVTSSIT